LFLHALCEEGEIKQMTKDRRDRQECLPHQISAGAIVWIISILCCALPLGWMVVALFSSPGAMAALHPIGFHLHLLARTLLYGFAVALLASGLALPVAVVLGKGRNLIAGVLGFVLPIALLLPSIVYAYGWLQVLRIGHINPVAGGSGDVLRCIWTLATWLWPIPAGVIGLSLRRLDGDLQQQAMLDGGYWRIVGRQLIGPGLAAFAIAAILAMQEFAVYEPTGISVVATEVRTVFETGQAGSMTNAIAAVQSGQVWNFSRSDQEHNAAAALVTAMPLLVVIGLLSWITIRLGRYDAGGDSIDPGAKPRVLEAGRISIALAGLSIGVTLILPLAAMIFSIHRTFDLGRIWRTFSPPVLGTLAVAGMTGVVAIVLAACGLVRRFRWVGALGLVTFLVGGPLLAIALIRLYNRRWLSLDHWIYNGPAIVVMAYVARFGWLAIWASRSTWQSRWRGVREMAAVDGAGAVAVARYVVWPLAWPLVAACGVLVMLLAMTEVPATIILFPLRPPVLTPQLMTWVHTLRSDDMLEGALLLAGLVILLALAMAGLGMLARGRRVVTTAKTLAVLLLGIWLAGCDRPGSPKAIWLETGAGEGEVVYPRAICYSPADDSYYIADRMARIQHLDHNGKFIAGWRMPAWAQGKPVGLSFGPDGNLWVPDTHYSRIMVYSPKGELLKQFGSFGQGPGQFVYPSDIAFDSKGRIFVSEFGDHDRVQVFDQNQKYLFEFGHFGDGDGEFSRPQSMVIDGATLYITDACNHRINVWTTDGRFVRNMGRIGSGLGEFRFPYGLDIDSKGRLVVCEFGNNRVQLIDKETGKGLATWGSGGREPGQLAYPWGVAVDKKDRVVAVDAGNNRLQVFDF
jgi:ABC-type Fe3+ transport system permease subunit/DNA-binding beta-propeller fold protein YncE